MQEEPERIVGPQVDAPHREGAPASTTESEHDLAALPVREVQDTRVRPSRDRELLWELDEDRVVAEVNAILRDARALPQLMRHDGSDYHLHATLPEAPLADRMAVEAAMAFADVVRQKQLDRLRVCGASDCEDVIVDLSKNHSRRYCSDTCSNRVNVAAFRARQR